MKVKETIMAGFESALEAAGYAGRVPLVLERPKLKEHGDISTPVALSLARVARKNPMAIAEEIANAAAFPEDHVSAVDVLKPGYINLRFAHDALVMNTFDISQDENDEYGKSQYGNGEKVQVEYVSANPTGPLVVVSARAAAVGSAIVNLLREIGYDADSEYYVNDYGNQVRKLGESLRFRVRQLGDASVKPPDDLAYPGEYLKEVAKQVSETEVAEWEAQPDGALTGYGRFATDRLLETIELDLKAFGVHFNKFFRESTLYPDRIKAARKLVEEEGHAYSEGGALYFRTTSFGDEKDRVLVKSDGNPTYFLADIAYHRDKRERDYKWILDLLGPDHHGHVPRMKAAASVIGVHEDWFNVMLVGWVRLVEGGKPVSMSKRAGEFISLRDLIEDVSPDVAKYFFLMRRAHTPLDFDLDLARKQSDENPVYYVQYAHARIASVERFARQKDYEIGEDGAIDHRKLEAPEERDLMVHLLYFPYVVEGAAISREPHRLTEYARELAALFHQFYHKHRVVTDDQGTRTSRMYLVGATKRVLKKTLHLLGVDAPESM
jgi:arginyl-tRNA synthetase